MGAHEGEQLPGMPQLPRLRLHGLHAAESARGAHARDLPGDRGEDLHRLPQGDRAPATGDDARSGAITPVAALVVPTSGEAAPWSNSVTRGGVPTSSWHG